MKSAIPIQTGAKSFKEDFSTTVIKTVMHKTQVPKASIIKPLPLEQPPPRVLANKTGPGVMALAAPPAAMPATSWEIIMQKPLTGSTALANTRERVTAGFKLPPETLAVKKMPTMTPKPKPKAIMMILAGFAESAL